MAITAIVGPAIANEAAWQATRQPRACKSGDRRPGNFSSKAFDYFRMGMNVSRFSAAITAFLMLSDLINHRIRARDL